MPRSKITLIVKLDFKVAEQVRRYCAARGLKQGFFVEKALIERIEREELNEDLLDFKKHKPGEKVAVSFWDFLAARSGRSGARRIRASQAR